MTNEQKMFLFWKIEFCNFSVRTHARLTKYGDIIYIGDLVHWTAKDLLKEKNFGPKSLKEIEEFLSKKGLSLGMEIPDWKMYQAILYFCREIRTVLWATPPNKLDKILDTLKDIVHQKGEYSMEETK